MGFRHIALLAAVLSFSGIAMASPIAPSADDDGGSPSAASSTAGGALHSAAGLVTAVGAAGAAAGISLAFHDHSTRVGVDVAPTRAPEISGSGALSGLVLLLGGAAVLRGRRQAEA